MHKPPLQDDIKLELLLIWLVSAILLQTAVPVIGNLRNTNVQFTKYAFQLNSAITPFPWQL